VMFTGNKPGNYTITATYSPAADSIHAGSSGTDMVEVIARSTQTTDDYPTPTPANNLLSSTATIHDTASGTKSPPVGTVSFTISGGPAGSNSSVTPCTLALSLPDALPISVMFTGNKPGNYTITATYSPAADSIHAGSSGTDMVQVIARSTQTTLDCPPDRKSVV